MMQDTTLDETLYFPLLGARGIPADTVADQTARWCVVDASGQPVTSDNPGLQTVSVSMKFGYLVLQAPGMLRLDIPVDVLEDDPSVFETVMVDGESCQAVDEGAWAETWVSQVLRHPARLLRLYVERR